MQRRKRRRSGRVGRPAMRSPGRPPAAGREEQQRFWKVIARGLSSEDAAVSCGVSPPVGGRWFREGGGDRAVLRGRRVTRSRDGISSGKWVQRYADACDRPPDAWIREVVGDGCAVVNRTAAEIQQRTGQPQ